MTGFTVTLCFEEIFLRHESVVLYWIMRCMKPNMCQNGVGKTIGKCLKSHAPSGGYIGRYKNNIATDDVWIE